ncbi:hypothetical protein D917_06444 [Trichinella nativa]|uniref:Uncharacterized protein n=1 Tax=Trichinella nativa TaxID=6335 RepID=A0A1Y3ESD4_9BILA|nr:hypothetical protein D917_06444 [Trichinella nativa]
MMCDGVSRICVYSRISSQMFCVVIRKRGDGAQIRCVYQLGALQQWASWYCSTHSDAAEMHHTKLYPWSRANAIYSSREVGASSLLKFTRFLPLLVGSVIISGIIPKWEATESLWAQHMLVESPLSIFDSDRFLRRQWTEWVSVQLINSGVGETGVPKYQTDVGRHLLQQYFPEKETRFMPIQHGQHLTDYLGRCAITQPVYIKWIVKEVGDSARSALIRPSSTWLDR